MEKNQSNKKIRHRWKNEEEIHDKQKQNDTVLKKKKFSKTSIKTTKKTVIEKMENGSHEYIGTEKDNFEKKNTEKS